MKLTKIQQDRIEKIIKEEMSSLKEGWKSAKSSKRSSSINETKMFGFSHSMSKGSITESLTKEMMDQADDCINSFHNELLRHVTSIARSNRLIGESTNASIVSDMIQEFDEQSMAEAHAECSDQIQLALESYAKKVASIAVEAINSEEF